MRRGVHSQHLFALCAKQTPNVLVPVNTYDTESSPPREADRMTVALTDRQREVIGLLLAGDSCKEAAGRLGVSVRTITHHSSHAYRILGVTCLRELVARVAAARGLGVEELLRVDAHPTEQLGQLAEVPVDVLGSVRHPLANGGLPDELVRHSAQLDGPLRNSHTSPPRNFRP